MNLKSSRADRRETKRFRASCINRANDGKNGGHQMYLTFVSIPWVDLSLVVVSLQCFNSAFDDLNLGDTYSVSFNLLFRC